MIISRKGISSVTLNFSSVGVEYPMYRRTEDNNIQMKLRNRLKAASACN